VNGAMSRSVVGGHAAAYPRADRQTLGYFPVKK
jgi:hypothetical protein